MDWIEKAFGISPDGGNGSIEALILASVLIVGMIVIWRTRKRIR